MNDPKESIDLLSAAELGDANAQAQLGEEVDNYYPDDDEYLIALNWLRKAAENGHVVAQHKLAAQYDPERLESTSGYLYEDICDAEKAQFWYCKAAGQSHNEAQRRLGNLYLEGRWVEQDVGLGLYWLQRVAEEKNSMEAILDIGNWYVAGSDSEADRSQAVSWYSKAADLGSFVAFHKLAELNLSEDRKHQDHALGALWYRRAAELGDRESQGELAKLYSIGKGVQKDHTKAAYWYEKAAEGGNYWDCYEMGKMFAEGICVPRDYGNAAHWYRRASEDGYSSAMYELSLLYSNGLGVEQSGDQALAWLRNAAEDHHEAACLKLARMYSYGHGVQMDNITAQRFSYFAYYRARDNSEKAEIKELLYSIESQMSDNEITIGRTTTMGEIRSRYVANKLGRGANAYFRQVCEELGLSSE